MAVGAAFRSNSHDYFLRVRAKTERNAIDLREHCAIKFIGATHIVVQGTLDHFTRVNGGLCQRAIKQGFNFNGSIFARPEKSR
jgi:hypothetical protein